MVSITRRYYRSGDGEYLINNATVRLKDIHELFMDTGLGRDGYSVIGQGKIDSIVSARSEDRREILKRRQVSPDTVTAKKNPSENYFRRKKTWCVCMTLFLNWKTG